MKDMRICGSEIVVGRNKLSTDVFVEHFKKQGKDVNMLHRGIFGRDSVCLSDEEETIFAIVLKACRKVLDKSKYEAAQMDFIIFSGFIAEYLMPQMALMIHQELQGKEDCFCFDMNANCIGMLGAIDLICGYCDSHKLSRALIVGFDDIRHLEDQNNEFTYGIYGNVASAIIIEVGANKRLSSLIDSKYSSTHQCKGIEYPVLYPEQGLSKVLNKKAEIPKFRWEKFESDHLYRKGRNNVRELLERNSISVHEVSLFCVSQLSRKYVHLFRDEFGLDTSKCPFYADQYGYSGTSSPFLVFTKAIKEQVISRGDIIVFWSLGIGSDDYCLLIKY